MKITDVSKFTFTKLVEGKIRRKTRDTRSVNYSKNGNTFVFPLSFQHDQLVLERYADMTKDHSEKQRIQKALKGNRQKGYMEVLNHILDGVKTDSVFISGKLKKMDLATNLYLVGPSHTFTRLEMGDLRTFETSYFYGFNLAFLNLGKIMLKPEVELAYVD